MWSEFTPTEALLNAMENASYQARLKLVRLLAQSPALQQEDPKLAAQIQASCQRIDEGGDAWEIIQDLYSWLDEEIIFLYKTDLYE